MTDFKNWLLFGSLLFSGLCVNVASATDADPQVLKDCASGDAICDLKLFKDLSRIYRAIGDEENVIIYIGSILKWANANVWTDQVKLTDQVEVIHLPKPIPSINPNKPGGVTTIIKNYLVRVPATGKFATLSAPAPGIALQAHMDMVTKSNDSSIPLYDQFKNGVQIEEDPSRPGWLQSKDKKTTLGCDDGCGMALMLRYMLDKSVAHPEMELLFTAAEENSLLGATFHDPAKMPITSKVMLGLDGANTDPAQFPAGTIIVGSLGGNRWINSSPTTSSDLASLGGNYRIVQIRFFDFPGGHSGITIHQPRLNSIVHGAGVVGAALKSALPQLHGIVSAIAPEADLADPKAVNSAKAQLNVIPSTLKINLVVRAGFDLEKFKAAAEAELAALALKFPVKLKKVINGVAQEVPPAITVKEIPTDTTMTKFVEISEAAQIVSALAQAPNGMLIVNPHLPQGSNGWQFSSNVGYFFLGVKPDDSTGKAIVESGFMARGLVDADFKVMAQNCSVNKSQSGALGVVLDFFATLILTTPTSKCEMTAGYLPWYEDPSKSRLVQLALKAKIFTTPVVFAAGLETSYWKAKYPHLEMVELGPDGVGAHETVESFRIDSLKELSQNIVTFINEIAK